MEEEPVEEYLRPGEVAAILHVSPKTVNRWAKEGLIPCIVTLGGHQRFLHADVMVAAAKMATGPTPREPRPPAPEKPAEKPSKSRRR